MRAKDLIPGIINFYISGFRNMPRWGVKMWAIIILKLFIMFFILKIFFFPDLLKKNFDSDQERGRYVLEQLTT